MKASEFTEEHRKLHFVGEVKVRVYSNESLTTSQVVVAEHLAQAIENGAQQDSRSPAQILQLLAALPLEDVTTQVVMLPADIPEQESSLPPPLRTDLIARVTRPSYCSRR